MEAAQTLGYRGGDMTEPTAFRNILTVSQGIGMQADQEYLAGMSKAAVMLNMSLISHHYRLEECENLLRPEHQPRALSAGRVDGIVLIHRWPMEVAAALRKNLPVVSIVHEYPGADVDIISLDDRGGMDMIISHLLSAGYKRIGFFGLCPEMTWSRSRFGAFAEAMVRHGCANRLGDIVEVTLAEALAETAFSESASLTKAKKLTNSGVDAWVGASEATSLSLYFAPKTAGVKIPSAVGITSFDSKLSAGNSSRPNFTSTQAASSELGASALRRIVHRIEGSDTFRRIILLPCSLHVGNTTRDSR